MMSIRALIVDDEQLARTVIRANLSADESIEIIGECDNGFEAFKLINELKPDLVFLDVMMPKVTGFEMLELLENPPVIIFSTAYDEYALKAFEANAADYLLKPYSKARFNEALAKAKLRLVTERAVVSPEQNLSKMERPETLSRIAVRTGGKIDIVSVEKIRYLEAMDDYVKIHTSSGTFLKQHTMKYFESHLPESDFSRIHRSFIVRLKEIARLEQMGKDTHVAILHDKTELQVSRSGYAKLREVLGF